MRRNLPVIAAILALGLTGLVAAPASAESKEPVLKHLQWSFEGPFGTFDQRSLQRGYKVYHEVCSTCHTMNLLSFRNLGEKYGPFYDEKYPNPNDNPYVKSIAGDFDIKDIDPDTGDSMKRKGLTSDRFPDPFPNEYAARASTGGSLPPDLSLIVKAREGGADYVYSILTGFQDMPGTMKGVAANMNFNVSFPGDLTNNWTGPKDQMPAGGLMGMKKPLVDGKVTFDDGTPSTLDQEAKDVTTFLAWASEPKQIERKRIGLWVMLYLIGTAVLAYASYRRVWRNESH